MKTRHLYLIVPLLIFPLFIIGCNNTEDLKKENTVDVTVAQIENYSSGSIVAYSGTIAESESIPLSFSSMGTVLRVLVSEGESVKKGQLLAELNDETNRNTYEMSLASLKQAEDAYKRLLPMYKNGSLPEIKMVEMETNLQKAKSGTAIAKKNLDDCKLFSPENGVIGKRSIEPGMSAMPGMTSLNIVKIKKVFAVVSVPENEISKIKKGQKAKIIISALDYAEFNGTIEEIGIIADPIVHTYKIKIGINNINLALKPGMVCSVSIDNSFKRGGLVAPNRSVLVDDRGRNFVYSLDSKENRVVRKYVKTGAMLNNGIEILEGLINNETVVVSGHQKLFDNAPVRVINK